MSHLLISHKSVFELRLATCNATFLDFFRRWDFYNSMDVIIGTIYLSWSLNAFPPLTLLESFEERYSKVYDAAVSSYPGLIHDPLLVTGNRNLGNLDHMVS
jgi:hypothetical protein